MPFAWLFIAPPVTFELSIPKFVFVSICSVPPVLSTLVSVMTIPPVWLDFINPFLSKPVGASNVFIERVSDTELPSIVELFTINRVSAPRLPAPDIVWLLFVRVSVPPPVNPYTKFLL